MWKRPLEMNKTAHISVRDFRKSDFTKKPNKAFSFFNILPNFMVHNQLNLVRMPKYGQQWAPRVRNPLKSSVTGSSLLGNRYFEIKFHKNIMQAIF